MPPPPLPTNIGFQVLRAYFEKMGWKVEVDEAQRFIQADIEMKQSQTRIGAWIDSSDDLFRFIVGIPIEVDRDQYSAMAEFCARANYSLSIGGFQFSMEEGSLRYHASLLYPPGQLGSRELHQTVCTSLAKVDEYFPTLMLLATGGLTPEAAVRVTQERAQAGEG